MRRISELQHDALPAFGETAMLQTSCHSAGANSVLHELPTAALKAAVQAANIGVWHWDLKSNIIDYSDLALSILGLQNSGQVTTDIMRALTHPEDLPCTREIARRALDPDVRGSEVYSYRIIRPDTSETRWIQAHGLAEFGLVNGVQAALTYSGWLCCTKRVRDSCRESSVVAGPHEQTDITDLQDDELG